MIRLKALGLETPYKSATIEPDPDFGGDWVRLKVEYNLGGKESLLWPSDQAARIFFGKNRQKGVKWVPEE